MEILIALILAVLLLKLVDKGKQTYTKIKCRENYDALQELYIRDQAKLNGEIKSLKLICSKYEQEFGKKEALRILTEIETKPLNNGDQL